MSACFERQRDVGPNIPRTTSHENVTHARRSFGAFGDPKP
jgi:hypothetical protein